MGRMRIVRVANFVTATSGGLRTALIALGRQYAAAGHEPVLVTPGVRAAQSTMDWGRWITVPGPALPGLGYRVLAARRPLAALLAELRPTCSRSPTAPPCAGPAPGPGPTGSDRSWCRTRR